MENLMQCPLFKGMNEEEIKKIIGNRLGVRTYQKEEIILREQQEYNYLLILLEGEVANSMAHISGKNMFIENIIAPNILAPAILYAENNKIPVNVVAVNRVRVLPITKIEFTYMLQQSPKLLMNFLQMISDRGRFLSSKVRFLSFGTIKSMIAGYLLEVSKQRGSLNFEIIHTQQELADMFGVTRPALANTIGKMIEDGLISSSLKRFTILNLRELQRIFKESV